jgi:hypothetical protein
MAVVIKAELDKKKADLDKLLSKLSDSETGQQKIPALMTMVRGAIRSSWAISPMKLAFFEKNREADTDPTTLRKWKMKCAYCGEYFGMGEVEVDHIYDNHSLKTPADFVAFFDNILDVQFKDVQILDKYKCHRVKTHKSKQGLGSMKEAAIDKIIIFLVKAFDTVELTRVLTTLGITPEGSAPKRRKQLGVWLTSLDREEKEYLDIFATCDYIMRLEKKRKTAKAFKLNKIDFMHLVRWKSFWSEFKITPKTIFKVLDET